MKKQGQPEKKLRVLNSNIIVKPLSTSVETTSGILITEQYEDKSFRGEVLLIGKEVKEIRVGEIVYFNRYSTTPFPYEENEYLMMKEEDVIAVE